MKNLIRDILRALEDKFRQLVGSDQGSPSKVPVPKERENPPKISN